MPVFRLACLLPILTLLFSCGPEAKQTPSLGEVYVGPNTLPLRKEISLKSPVTATVKHGERLDIVMFRHRFLKVRTAGGAAGWTDVRQLISSEQMSGILALSARSAGLPSQGVAATSEPLNLHIDSNRASPSFLQVPAAAKCDIIGHRVAPRVQPAPEAFHAPAPAPRQPKHPVKATKETLKLSPPPPPKPPANWLQLSQRARTQTDPAPVPVQPVKPPEAKAPVVLEDWSLVRTADGKAGWALSRLLNMAIPDDVAQYAEGHRITSYFPMGEVRDDDAVKYNWLWTTVGSGVVPFEFDSFRFFIWSRRHHRYETAYIERNVMGHYPVEVNNRAATPTFSLVLEDDNGKLWKTSYLFEGGRVHKLSSAPYQPPPEKTPVASLAAAPNPVANGPSWFARAKQKVASMFGR